MNVKMQEIAELITDNNDPENVFELLDILGQGSYGSVSKALHKQTGVLYAIKVLPATSGLEIASIKKQIGVLKQCDDDHIVRYYSTFFKDNHLWIVMEYCVGGSVTDIMQITKKKLNQNQIASILESALKGLTYIHAKKKIHRDIKAANILLDTRGFAKLADFGVSASALYTNDRFRTHIGSPYWMSPQILKYSEYDQKTDIWSLGITAIELAEGQVPNSHIKPFMVIFMTKSNPVQGFKEPSLWSPEFNDFVKKCLQINPVNRPEASELLQHEFIKRYSRGQRLLSQLVLSCLQEIEQFRMNQSNNSSFAQIIVDDGKDTKTVIEKKQQNSQNASLKSSNPDEGCENSMIVHSQCGHNREVSQVGSVIINNDNSMVINQDDQADNNVLKNYINELKSIDNAHVKCVQMLEKTINAYDDKCLKEIERVFKDYQERAKNDIQYLKQLKQKERQEGTELKKNGQKMNNNEEINVQQLRLNCRIVSANDLQQFLYPDHRIAQVQDHQSIATNKNLIRDNAFNKVLTEENENFNFYKQLGLKHNQSLADKKTQSTINNSKQRKQAKSFLYSQPQPVEMSNNDKFINTNPHVLKNYEQTNILSTQKDKNSCQQSQSHKSSKLVIKMHETPITFSKKIQQFREDPDVLEYLQKNFPQGNHHKSSIPTVFQSSKVYTEASIRQQKSTQHSISRGKNKSSKNLKGRKTKTRLPS